MQTLPQKALESANQKATLLLQICRTKVVLNSCTSIYFLQQGTSCYWVLPFLNWLLFWILFLTGVILSHMKDSVYVFELWGLNGSLSPTASIVHSVTFNLWTCPGFFPSHCSGHQWKCWTVSTWALTPGNTNGNKLTTLNFWSLSFECVSPDRVYASCSPFIPSSLATRLWETILELCWSQDHLYLTPLSWFRVSHLITGLSGMISSYWIHVCCSKLLAHSLEFLKMASRKICSKIFPGSELRLIGLVASWSVLLALFKERHGSFLSSVTGNIPQMSWLFKDDRVAWQWC